MILVDTGPFVALFDPRDGQHERCRRALREFREALVTTVSVLTEAFHLLSPASLGAVRLSDFVRRGGVSVWFMNEAALARAFDLMDRYRDHPMDLADASLVLAAETLKTQRVFTIDRDDFATYRIESGRRHLSFEMLPNRS